jgi:hypothetical protein
MEMDNDNKRLWPLSSDDKGTGNILSCCPKEEFKKNLGKTEVKKLETYLIQDTMTNKGRNCIAEYHGFTNE